MTTPSQTRPSPMTFKGANTIVFTPGLLVKCSASDTVNLSGVGEGANTIGTAEDSVTGDAATFNVPVRDRKTPGLVQLVADGAIAAAAAIYAAAGGKSSATVSGTSVGYAVTAAAANNDVYWAYVNA